MKNRETKKQQFELILNEAKHDLNDPTKTHASFIIMDTTKSLNNVKVTEDVLLEAKESILGMPIVTKYLSDKEDFGTHEEFLDEDKNGKQFVNRDTIAIGSFTSEGYMKTVEIDGEDREVFVADAVLWRSRYEEAIELLIKLFNDGNSLPMSCEYLYSNHAFIDGVEHHLSPIYFEGHCILGEKIIPAYESATMLSLNNLQEFNRLVAQAINQNKEVNSLTGKAKTQLNELSHDDIRGQIREQVNVSLKEDDWCWVVEVFETHTIIEIEEEKAWNHYRFDYVVENDVVTVNLESKQEVNEKREWVTVTNELQEQVTQLNSKIEELTNTKSDLVVKLESATDTITQLNSELDVLKPIQEQMLNAQLEAKLDEAKTKYSKVFNSKDFESEEVQSLIATSILDSEEGVDAKLALNEMILEQFNTKQEVKSQVNTVSSKLAGLASPKREKLSPDLDDPLSDMRI